MDVAWGIRRARSRGAASVGNGRLTPKKDAHTVEGEGGERAAAGPVAAELSENLPLLLSRPTPGMQAKLDGDYVDDDAPVEQRQHLFRLHAVFRAKSARHSFAEIV